MSTWQTRSAYTPQNEMAQVVPWWLSLSGGRDVCVWLVYTHLVHLAGHHARERMHLLLGDILRFPQLHHHLLGGKVSGQLRPPKHPNSTGSPQKGK
jgi:hypothetical protein